jgi:hypothetical protein
LHDAVWPHTAVGSQGSVIMGSSLRISRKSPHDHDRLLAYLMATVPYLLPDTMASAAAGTTGTVAQRLGFGALGPLALRSPR